jgi:hypothetical protein
MKTARGNLPRAVPSPLVSGLQVQVLKHLGYHAVIHAVGPGPLLYRLGNGYVASNAMHPVPRENGSGLGELAKQIAECHIFIDFFLCHVNILYEFDIFVPHKVTAAECLLFF